MSKKTLKCDNVEVNEKPIAFDSDLMDKILVSDKFEYSGKGFKYFIGYKNNNIIRPLCIVLLQMIRRCASRLYSRYKYWFYYENRKKELSSLFRRTQVWNKEEKDVEIYRQ